MRAVKWWLVLAGVALACRGAPREADARPGTPVAALAAVEAKPMVLQEVSAVFTGPDGRRAQFRLEVADTPATRETGLMNRKAMAPDRGMVFVFPAEHDQTFWMKNTYLPLDMVFVGSDGRVAGVVEDARPLTLDVRSVGKPSRFVVELNARTAAARGIREGARVTFEPPLKVVDE